MPDSNISGILPFVYCDFFKGSPGSFPLPGLFFLKKFAKKKAVRITRTAFVIFNIVELSLTNRTE